MYGQGSCIFQPTCACMHKQPRGGTENQINQLIHNIFMHDEGFFRKVSLVIVETFCFLQKVHMHTTHFSIPMTADAIHKSCLSLHCFVYFKTL